MVYMLRASSHSNDRAAASLPPKRQISRCVGAHKLNGEYSQCNHDDLLNHVGAFLCERLHLLHVTTTKDAFDCCYFVLIFFLLPRELITRVVNARNVSI